MNGALVVEDGVLSVSDKLAMRVTARVKSVSNERLLKTVDLSQILSYKAR